jgi:PAP2 superfamily protein
MRAAVKPANDAFALSRSLWFSLIFVVLCGACGCAFAAGGLFGIDHRVGFDNSGIWNRNVQHGVEYGTIAVVVGGALWEGSEDRLGRTFWQAFDSGVLSSLTAQAGKYVFTRARPSQTNDPNKFFQGSGHYSFPSAEVAEVAGAVAPFVFEYGREHPAVYALEALTLYDMVARVKSQSHWQSDVLVSAALGTAFGYYAHQREHPILVQLIAGGVWVGLKRQF